jgi:dTDP-4-dehydrorhamnose reductase
MLAQAIQTSSAKKPSLSSAPHPQACLVHYSTDYVFDGRHKGYNPEDAPTAPLSVYGRTKLQGEHAIAQGCRRHLIFRTSWVVGHHGGNFLKTMLKLGQERDSLSVVGDQHGAPTSASLIATVTAKVLDAMMGQAAGDHRWGTYHLVAGGETTWYHYAQYVLRNAQRLGLRLKVSPEAILEVKTSDFPSAATRPLNSCLSTQKLRENFSIELPEWQLGVDEVLARVLNQIQGETNFAEPKQALNTITR